MRRLPGQDLGGRFFFGFTLGILCIIGGFIASDDPLLTAVSLTLFSTAPPLGASR